VEEWKKNDAWDDIFQTNSSMTMTTEKDNPFFELSRSYNFKICSTLLSAETRRMTHLELTDSYQKRLTRRWLLLGYTSSRCYCWYAPVSGRDPYFMLKLFFHLRLGKGEQFLPQQSSRLVTRGESRDSTRPTITVVSLPPQPSCTTSNWTKRSTRTAAERQRVEEAKWQPVQYWEG
jgi:hypothetical protein